MYPQQRIRWKYEDEDEDEGEIGFKVINRLYNGTNIKLKIKKRKQ